jgi:hypothetical protein
VAARVEVKSAPGSRTARCSHSGAPRRLGVSASAAAGPCSGAASHLSLAWCIQGGALRLPLHKVVTVRLAIEQGCRTPSSATVRFIVEAMAKDPETSREHQSGLRLSSAGNAGAADTRAVLVEELRPGRDRRHGGPGSSLRRLLDETSRSAATSRCVRSRASQR